MFESINAPEICHLNEFLTFIWIVSQRRLCTPSLEISDYSGSICISAEEIGFFQLLHSK
jgi:hypothetical protein